MGSANGECIGWAARDPSGTLSPYTFNRRCVGADDVSITIMYCGVCHADVHWTRDIHSNYPLVPGHEIVGSVKEVGSNVHSFKVGQHVGVGTYVNSCRDCEYCDSGDEVNCSNGFIFTFDGVDADGTITKGGYSTSIVVHQRNQPGKSLGVIGLGGLGHLAVKFGKAFGLKVTVLSTSTSKKEEALNLLGADHFVISSDETEMKALKGSFDFLINAASGDVSFDLHLSLLKALGVLALVGFPSEVKFLPGSLNQGAKIVAGSITGGTKETQEMMAFCASHKIYPEIELIPIHYCNEALDRLVKKDVKYRFVIDIANSLSQQDANI